MYKLYLILVLAVFPAYCQQKFKIANGQYVGRFNGYGMINSGEFPFLVYTESIVGATYPNGTQYFMMTTCGGSIIKSNTILTAAHCVVFTVAQNMTVYAGILNQKFPHLNPGLQIAEVRRIVRNERFDFSSSGNDIALLFLLHPLTMTQYVNTISLPTAWDYIDGLPALAVGWGLDQYGSNPDWLQKAHLVLFPSRLCQFYTNQMISDSMTCAIDPNLITTVCKGDSGGPLVVNRRLIGITSFGTKPVILPNNKITCRPNVPSVFLKVLSFVPWILSKIQEDTSLVGDIRRR